MATSVGSKEAYTKTKGSLTEPDSKTGNVSAEPNVLYTQHLGPKASLTVYDWGNSDNTAGIFLGTQNNSIHFTPDGNMVFAGSKPSQSGCGGKMIENVAEKLTKAKGIYIEVTGPDEDGVKNREEKNGDIEETKDPAYSLKIYGDCFIESIGGDVKIKGDNITLNANSTLNLTSGKDINIQAGEKGGNINLTGGTIKLEASFLNQKIDSGVYIDGAPEVQTDQKKKGSNVTTNTFAVNQNISGNQTTIISGNLDLGITGNFTQTVDLDYGIHVKKAMSTLVSGQSKLEVQGVTSNTKGTSNNSSNTSKNLPTYQVVVGPSSSKTVPAYKVDSQGSIELAASLGEFRASVGPKSLSEFKFDKKEGSWTVGQKLGYLNMSPKNVELGYTKTSSLNLSAEKVSLSAPAIFLN